MVADPVLGTTATRNHHITVPESASRAQATEPAPLMFWFHGQHGDSGKETSWKLASGCVQCAEELAYISVHLMGISYRGDSEAAGSVPADGYQSTCATRDTDYSCYKSCIKLGRCGRCSWSTCLDDVGSVKAMLAHFSEDLRIGMSRLFLGGQGNGGMLMH